MCLDESIVVLLMSELCKTLEYEFLDPPNASVVQQAQCRTGLPLSSIELLSWFNSLHSSLIHHSSKANLITAQQVDYVVVQLPVPSKVFVFLENVCAPLERTFSLQCRRTLRGRSTHSTEGMCLFPRPLRVSLLCNCKAFNRDNFPKTGAAKKNPS